MDGAIVQPDSGQNSRIWLPEIDRILLVGMKHGLRGVREATKRVLLLRSGFTRADCWKRLRSLRESNHSNYPQPSNWPPAIKELLCEGYREGGLKKRQAIKALRELYPGLPSNAASRFARRQGWIPNSSCAHGRRPWTDHEQRKLFEFAGYDTAARIAERLGRSEDAIRYRLKSLGLSVKVKDGWSSRAFQEMLHIGPIKFRRLIVNGLVRVRDPRITASSLNCLLQQRTLPQDANIDTLAPADFKTLRKNQHAYSWGNAARLLGADLAQLRECIVRGDLKIVDGFVTERAFQDFCEKHGSEVNTALLGDAVRDWLVEGYCLSPSVGKNNGSTPGSEKHALVVRRCPECRKTLRGNIFFRHIKNCKRGSCEGIAVAGG
jgi:hypothetical protein